MPLADQPHVSSRSVARSPLGRVTTISILHKRFSSHPQRSQAKGIDVIAETPPLRLIAFAPLAASPCRAPLVALGNEAR